MNERRDTWNQRHTTPSSVEVQACAVLRAHEYLLPASGSALDVACGRGGNALFMARRGLHVSAWDLADAAIAHVLERADSEGLTIAAEQRDVTEQPPPANSFDVITVSRFLVRELCGSLASALRPNGLIYYQTFVRDKTEEVGPRNPEFLLRQNELLSLFAPLRVLVFRDEGSAGRSDRGVRNESWLIAQRPA